MNDVHERQEDRDETLTPPTPVHTPPTRQTEGRRSLSNNLITARNGGVVHQFVNDIGGCSANYR